MVIITYRAVNTFHVLQISLSLKESEENVNICYGAAGRFGLKCRTQKTRDGSSAYVIVITKTGINHRFGAQQKTR